ncbi:MAG: hypothetical protein M0Z66_04195 [Thermaerobacter sp.]|nr:hypothetical protein [Thermaerobacter sp.]
MTWSKIAQLLLRGPQYVYLAAFVLCWLLLRGALPRRRLSWLWEILAAAFLGWLLTFLVLGFANIRL